MKIKSEWIGRFRQDATLHLQEIQKCMDKLAPALPADPETTEAVLRQLFVRVHNIKGTAAMLGQMEVAEVAARLEKLWAEVALEPARLDQALLDQARSSNEELARRVALIQPSVVSDEAESKI